MHSQAGVKLQTINSPMLDTFLIASDTVISGKGDSAAVDITEAREHIFLLTLEIGDVLEQESLDIAIYGSADGAAWTEKPVLSFPQQFYPGQVPLLLDLTSQPELKFLRAHWEANRWGRGSMDTMFRTSLRVREVAREMLEGETR